MVVLTVLGLESDLSMVANDCELARKLELIAQLKSNSNK
ncbi:hypothetical protein JCM19231_2997 [Vibrio ishigakensis]|uniref:Uncharacterized protein n=2 Tax=Vibrio ishigakensis TaxID=1481914 RepID=A0A0B8NLR4_9VIBR|nr:hypothetical protein JCM19231_2997 [Vibrio ishigakensis]